MSVTGYLALYTTLLGWEQYQNLWGMMVGTGLVFIPFIGIVLKCFLEPFESQEPKSAAVITMRRLMISIIGALLVIEFCCVPAVPLDPKVLHFEPACNPSARVATPGHTGTTYDNQFPVPTGIKVPVIWYMVMAVSNGFTHAAIEGASCSAINYQALQDQIDVSKISDPALKKETMEFYNDCYIPAYAKYMSGDLTDTQKAEIQQYQTKYGKDDLGWVGSQALLNTSGFYNGFAAKEPIEGFEFDPDRDQFEGQVSNHSQWGDPYCNAWWNNPQNGLHARLENALPPAFLQNIAHIGSSQYVADAGIRGLIKNSFDSGMSLGEIARGYETDNDSNGSGLFSNALADLGLVSHSTTYYPKLYLLINSLPVIQALLLLSIYALLALVIPFSSYKLHFIITGAAAIFAITFWSYLWHLLGYINNALIGALYPVNPNEHIYSWHELLQGDATGGAGALFVHFIIGAMYIALPMLFLTLMSWAGLKVSSSIMSAVSDMKAPANSAGQAGGQIMNTAIKAALSKYGK